MTFIVNSPVAIRNIRLRDALDGTTPYHPTSTFPDLYLDDDGDLNNGHLGGISGNVLEVGQYVHIVLDGINPSNYGHRFWYYDAPPDSFGYMSNQNYLTFISFHNYPFDFFYELATTSTGWKTIIDFNWQIISYSISDNGVDGIDTIDQYPNGNNYGTDRAPGGPTEVYLDGKSSNIS